MDQFTRRIIGFGVHRGIVDGLALCRMFQQAIRGQSLPKYLSTDNDPLYLVLALHGRFHAHSTSSCLRVFEGRTSVTHRKITKATGFWAKHRGTIIEKHPTIILMLVS